MAEGVVGYFCRSFDNCASLASENDEGRDWSDEQDDPATSAAVWCPDGVWSGLGRRGFCIARRSRIGTDGVGYFAQHRIGSRRHQCDDHRNWF